MCPWHLVAERQFHSEHSQNVCVGRRGDGDVEAEQSNILLPRDAGAGRKDTGAAVTHCICIHICTHADGGEMICTQGDDEKEEEKKKSTGFAVTNATKADTHTRTKRGCLMKCNSVLP